MNFSPHGKLWLGNCLDLLSRVPDQSISMAFCDLPYGVTGCHWDSIIPIADLWIHFERICKPHAPVLFTAIQPFTTAIMNSHLETFKHEWIWNKNNSAGFAAAKHKPLSTCESILVFGISKRRVVYHPQKVIRGKPVRNSNAGSRSDNYGRMKAKNTPTLGNEYHPKMLIEITKSNANPEYGLHPTQKPVALLEYLIRTYTAPGDHVLDPTAGSGTTAIAAINTGRRFLCIEKDSEIYQTALKRIKARVNRNDFGILHT